MASVSQIIGQFPCMTLSKPPLKPQLTSRLSIVSLNVIKSTAITSNSILKSRLISYQGTVRARPSFVVRAVDENEYVPENDVPSATVAVVEEKPKEVTEFHNSKKALVQSFYGTDRGLKANSETRLEIDELITQLEAKNPTPAPTEALTLLNGKWILAYTSFSRFFPLLSRATLPLVVVEEISQSIDSEKFTVENSVRFAGPLATGSVSANAKYEVRSPKRVKIKFEEGIIGTPQLTESLEVPENVEFLGQKIDLTRYKGLIKSVQDRASSVAKTISSKPPLKFSLPYKNAESWLLTTYLDEDLRISRGDDGSVFVLIKEGSSLLTP